MDEPGLENQDAAARRRRGSLLAVGAFAIWGFLPIYWKAIGHVGVLTIVGHRVVWSLVFLIPLLAIRGTLSKVAQGFTSPSVIGAHLLSGVLLGVNWFLFILATLTDRVLEAAFGYFLNPLLNVAIGWFLLGERRDKRQWLAVGLAAAGVFLQARAIGGMPWFGLGLAVSFALYGLARKKSPFGSLEGLAMETVLLIPVAIGFFAFAPTEPLRGTRDIVLLGFAGVVTAMPLLLFASAARRLDLARLGMLQFLAPTLHFLVGHFVYGEALSPARLLSFVVIWTGVAVFLSEHWSRSKPPPAVPG
ncbi:MAG: EamA family transporter RarD [Verrucomicrobiales bacterium]